MKDEKSGKIDLRKRTKEYALRIIRLYSSLPKQTVAQVTGKQLLRSGISVAAHYREACRAKSDADFVNKIETALQELDETDLWLEILVDSGIVKAQKMTALRAETNVLISVFVAMTKSVKARNRKK